MSGLVPGTRVTGPGSRTIHTSQLLCLIILTYPYEVLVNVALVEVGRNVCITCWKPPLFYDHPQPKFSP